MELKNSHAIITGGASGLGAATASKVIDRGGKVTIIELDEQRAAATVEKLGTNNSHSWAMDVTDEEGINRTIEAAKEQFGEISLLANCAGIGSPGRII